jgi:hypothetical protein
MIWMGVEGPKDFVAIVNRFPPHDQCVMEQFKRMSVADSNVFCIRFQPFSTC